MHANKMYSLHSEKLNLPAVAWTQCSLTKRHAQTNIIFSDKLDIAIIVNWQICVGILTRIALAFLVSKCINLLAFQWLVCSLFKKLRVLYSTLEFILLGVRKKTPTSFPSNQHGTDRQLITEESSADWKMKSFALSLKKLYT